MIEFVVRIPLIKPAGLAGIRIAREYAAAPFIVAGAQLWIPRAGIRGAVKDQVLLGVV